MYIYIDVYIHTRIYMCINVHMCTYPYVLKSQPTTRSDA